MNRIEKLTPFFLRWGCGSGLWNDATNALRNAVLIQSNLERLERTVDRQSGDIAGLRDAMSVMNERIVRMETKFEIYEAQARQRRLEQ